MYRIPDDFNLINIKNEVIIQIAFGLNFITLFFSKGFIQFSGSFSFYDKGQKYDYEEVYPVQDDYNLLKLLEKKITQVITNEDRNVLILEFEDKIILKLIGSESYESYTLNIDGKEIII